MMDRTRLSSRDQTAEAIGSVFGQVAGAGFDGVLFWWAGTHVCRRTISAGSPVSWRRSSCRWAQLFGTPRRRETGVLEQVFEILRRLPFLSAGLGVAVR